MTELLEYERKHLSELRKIGAECCVLLKRNGDFPLGEPCKIALYGNGARKTVKGGTGSGEVNSHTFVNIEDGLEDAGFEVTTKEWLRQYDESVIEANKAFSDAIREEAKKQHKNAIMMAMGAVRLEHDYELAMNGEGDVAIYVLSRISGEGNDRKNEKGDYKLTDSETRDILDLNNRYKKFMLIINAGGPVDLSNVNVVDNIMVMSQLGAETGNIIADLLLGKSYPSGKLSTTWARYEDYPHMGDFGDPKETLYKEGIYVGYKYFDSVKKDPLYRFGYGLGYTDFLLSFKHMEVTNDLVEIETDVKNIGKYNGKEVVQIYVSEPEGKLDKVYQKLAAFNKTDELKSGETMVVRSCFHLSDLASYDSEKQAYVLERGDYIIRVGNCSTNTEVYGKINLLDDIVVRNVRNVMGNAGFKDFKCECNNREGNETANVFTLTPDCLASETVKYDLDEKIEFFTQDLSDEQLAMANVGQFSGGLGALSIVGNAAKEVAGAAGQSTDILKEKGLPSIIMADGPAGIRLNREYVMTSKGAKGLSGALPESMMEMLPKTVRTLMIPRVSKKQKIYYQYASALPIGTAIAQSWNVDLAERCGDIVGTEMKMFKVDLWLAPALNIHRDVLCGRNFEYYSEDPLLSGLIAAAVTNGVQKHKGCGVTIKHFAANNQETNRYDSDSRVSERALRELYLRTFEICIKNSDPVALMTSYNLINGEHTCQSFGLIHDILRAEWGYDGLVMTDWLVRIMFRNPKNQMINAGLIAKASGDLVMPGSKTDYKEILNMMKKGSLPRSRVRMNVSRLYRAAKRLEKC
ncbi:MAG: glycoside hydrolase family 3 C-terminal domain-containing protein [Erysipelotrichaceae bacterium]|nr:glycoside hydrolase family 3 C-terminal domain-containing protein [Erysipelotrichaceae bacterium]